MIEQGKANIKTLWFKSFLFNGSFIDLMVRRKDDASKWLKLKDGNADDAEKDDKKRYI